MILIFTEAHPAATLIPVLRNILVGLAGTSQAANAVRLAVDLARRHEARITAVNLLGPDPAGDGGSGEVFRLREGHVHQARERMVTALTRLRRECIEAPMPFQAYDETDASLPTLKRLGKSHDITLLALRGCFDLGLFDEGGDGLIHLFADGVRPILAVSSNMREISRILVAYNGTAASAGAMKRMVQLGLWKDADLRVVAFDVDRADARSFLDPAVEYCRTHGYRVRGEVLPGPADPGILEAARKHEDDLVVLGVSPRGVFARKLLGDMLLGVIRGADRPLFLGH